MRYATVCSGIEAPSTAWHGLGWKPVFFSEIEKFPSAVLSHHYPDVPNYGDMTKFKEWPDESIQLICAGTPCQAFSVAGLRKGLDDPRGNLTLGFLGIVKRYSSRWVVWENVPGVLSEGTGAFGSFLAGLGELGYGFAYRVLDAQYFGVAQRRRRVFVVAYLGDWRYPAAVLFEPESLRGYPAPSRQEGQTTPTLSASGAGASRTGGQAPEADFYITMSSDISLCLNAGGMGRQDYETETKVVQCLRFGGDGGVPSSRGENLVPMTFKVRCGCEGGGKGFLGQENKAMTLATGHDQNLFDRMSVRRLTPVECERLQGFPDNYTRIPYKGKPASECPDGPRYKALGNSMAVPVMRWIGKRIQLCEGVIEEQSKLEGGQQ